jgi:hypothetical protein
MQLFYALNIYLKYLSDEPYPAWGWPVYKFVHLWLPLALAVNTSKSKMEKVFRLFGLFITVFMYVMEMVTMLMDVNGLAQFDSIVSLYQIITVGVLFVGLLGYTLYIENNKKCAFTYYFTGKTFYTSRFKDILDCWANNANRVTIEPLKERLKHRGLSTMSWLQEDRYSHLKPMRKARVNQPVLLNI